MKRRQNPKSATSTSALDKRKWHSSNVSGEGYLQSLQRMRQMRRPWLGHAQKTELGENCGEKEAELPCNSYIMETLDMSS